MKVNRLIGIAAGIILSAAMFFTITYAGERGAKSLFYDPKLEGNVQVNPDKQPAVSLTKNIGGLSGSEAGYNDTVNPGVMYWIELVRPGGGVMRVSNDRAFRSGDQIRIHLTTNADGYLQVMHNGSTGASGIIKIAASPGGEVKMGTEYVVPSNGGWLRFDNNAGQEKLNLVFASTKSSNEVLDKIKKGQSEVTALISQYKNSPNRLLHIESGSKDLIVTDGAAAPSSAPAQKYVGQASPASFNVNGDSDFKVEDAIYNAPGNYIVNNARGVVKEPVVVEIVLNHQP